MDWTMDWTVDGTICELNAWGVYHIYLLQHTSPGSNAALTAPGFWQFSSHAANNISLANNVHDL
jgi:hypothetical protein